MSRRAGIRGGRVSPFRKGAFRESGLRLLAVGLLSLASVPQVAADPCDPFRYRELASPPVVRDADSFLLAVEREGIPPSFLLGAFHSADPRVRERWEPVGLLFATGGVRLMVTERAEDPPVSGADDPRLLPPGASGLQTQMEGLGLGERFATEAAGHGIGAALFDRLRPWVAAALIEQGPARDHPESGRILDDVLRTEARALGVPLQPLETMDSLAAEQDRTLGPDDQRALLAAAVCNAAASARLVAEQTDAYVANDPRRFHEAMARLGGADPELEARVMAGLVEARNERFWQLLAPEFAKGGVLAAVGNLHVLGTGGLARRLADAGFKVTALDPDRLRVSLHAAQVPALVRWVAEWAGREEGVPDAGFAGVTIEPRSAVSLRRLRCPGQRCRIDGTYLPGEQRILLESGVYARLLAGGAAPQPVFRNGALALSDTRAPGVQDNATAYAESILVRELVRHALHGKTGAGNEASGHGVTASCRESGILHRASLAQAAYLRDRGAGVQAHIFPLDPRCAP